MEALKQSLHTYAESLRGQHATRNEIAGELDRLAASLPSPDPRPAAQPGVVKEAVRRELADVEASLDDAISYLVDLAGAKPTPMSPQNCRIHIDHARMSARNLAALAAPVSQEPVADNLETQVQVARIIADRDALTEGEPSEAEVERPNWPAIYKDVSHAADRDGELVAVTRETLRLARAAIRSAQEKEAYNNFRAAEIEINRTLFAAKGGQADG